jgi:DNA-binding MarR family transcriptional regulator
MYNRELQPSGLELTQVTLLMALERTGEITQGNLGKLLALDSTSLTRMLKTLIKLGWIGVNAGNDRRFRNLRLTRAGRSKLKLTLPHWKRAQDRMQSALGEDTMRQLAGVLAQVTTAIAGG